VYDPAASNDVSDAVTLQKDAIPAVEEAINENLLAILFPDACGDGDRRKMTSEAVVEGMLSLRGGGGKGRKLEAQTLGLSPNPLDVVQQSDACETAVDDPNNKCAVTRGGLTIFLLDPTEEEENVARARVLDSIEAGMEEDTLVSSHVSIVEIVYKERMNGDPPIETENPNAVQGADLRANSGGSFSVLVAAGVASLAIIGAILGWRSLKKKGDKDDDSVEMGSNQGGMSDAAAGALEEGSEYSSMNEGSSRLSQSSYSESDGSDYTDEGDEDDETMADDEDERLRQLQMVESQPVPLSAITEEPSLENLSSRETESMGKAGGGGVLKDDGSSTIASVQTMSNLSLPPKVLSDRSFGGSSEELLSSKTLLSAGSWKGVALSPSNCSSSVGGDDLSFAGYHDAAKYDKGIDCCKSLGGGSLGNDCGMAKSSCSVDTVSTGAGNKGDLDMRKCTLGISSRDLHSPEDISKANSIMFSPPDLREKNLDWEDDDDASAVSLFSIRKLPLSDSEDEGENDEHI